jgi:hypothetical protein
MTREQAERERDRLAREHPDRATHSWMVRADAEGSWTVVKVGLPPGTRVDPLAATTEARPRPPQADDVRDSFSRNVGGPYMG